jgi:hypothetical protein
MKTVLTLIVIWIVISMVSVGCDVNYTSKPTAEADSHTHQWGAWTDPDGQLWQYRHCTTCNYVRCRKLVLDVE